MGREAVRDGEGGGKRWGGMWKEMGREAVRDGEGCGKRCG